MVLLGLAVCPTSTHVGVTLQDYLNAGQHISTLDAAGSVGFEGRRRENMEERQTTTHFKPRPSPVH